MREENSKTQSLRKMLERYNKVSKIFMTSLTYLSILEENEGVIKVDGKHQWSKQTPVKYAENIVPLWGNIPIIIDDYGPEWGVVEG